MSDKEENTTIGIDHRGGQNLTVTIPNNLEEIIAEDAEELGMSKSAACRYWIQIGRKLGPIYDPREDDGDTSQRQQPSPFHEHLPDDPDEAITLDEYVDRLEKYMFDICESDELINREGREVYLG
jgi:hypothetical protein